MSIAFSAVLLDITVEKGGTEEGKQKNKNKAYALPHDLGETMTIKWPAADPPTHTPPAPPSLPLSLYPFLCTLMYKIAPIHKQHHYFQCLPTLLPLFLLPFLSPITPTVLHLPHANVQSFHSLQSYFQVHFAGGFFCGHG